MLIWTFGFLETYGTLPAGTAQISVNEQAGAGTIVQDLQNQAGSFRTGGEPSYTTLISNTYKTITAFAMFRFNIAGSGANTGVVGTINAFFSGIFGILNWLIWISMIGRLVKVLQFRG